MNKILIAFIIILIGYIGYVKFFTPPKLPIVLTQTITKETKVDTVKFTNDVLFKYRAKFNKYILTQNGQWVLRKNGRDTIITTDTLFKYIDVAALDTAFIKKYKNYNVLSNFKALYAPEIGAVKINYSSLIKDSLYSYYTLDLEGSYRDSIWSFAVREDLTIPEKTVTVYRDNYIEHTTSLLDCISIGPFIGYTYSLKENTFTPSIGIGLTYKLF